MRIWGPSVGVRLRMIDAVGVGPRQRENMARTKAAVQNSRAPPPRDVMRQVHKHQKKQLAEQKRKKREDKRENKRAEREKKLEKKKKKKEKKKKENKAFEILSFDAMNVSQKELEVFKGVRIVSETRTYNMTMHKNV